MSHPLRCRCGTVQGFVANPRSVNRAVCYCGDCRAFAYALGRERDVLDERGGSDVIQTLPKNVTFTRGIESLACLRLTEKGLLRWYAGCCNTPIANMLGSPKFSFVGLVSGCLEQPGTSLDEVFGPVRVWVHTQGAKGDPKPRQVGVASTIGWFLVTTLKARLNGDYKRNPFFRAETGAPIVPPRVLSGVELANVRNAVSAAAV
jgi:hypothetical protein